MASRRTRLPLDQPTFVDEVTHKAKEKWSDTEIEALVEFLLFHSTGDRWPTHKQDGFWSSAVNLSRQEQKLVFVEVVRILFKNTWFT